MNARRGRPLRRSSGAGAARLLGFGLLLAAMAGAPVRAEAIPLPGPSGQALLRQSRARADYGPLAEQFLTQANNEVDAVLSQNDGMATGVVAALEAQGLAGQVPVSGQDGDAAALNRVALGTQSVSVWKDARELGKAAGEAAVALAQGTALADIAGVVQFDSPGGNSMTSILLEPIPITQENLQVVLDAEWIDEATLCQDVPSGSVAGCP